MKKTVPDSSYTQADVDAMSILGLGKTERAIFFALTHAKSIQEIHADTKISRTGVKYSIQKLAERGLVEKTKGVGSRSRYVGITKERLASRFYTLADSLNASGRNKKTVRVRANLQSEFSIQIGLEEVLDAHEQIVSENKNERLYGIQPNKSWQTLQTKIPKEAFIRFNELIRSNHLIIDAILADNVYSLYKPFVAQNPERLAEMAESLGERMADYVLVNANFFDHGAELWIYKDTVFIINWQDEIGIRISNKDVRDLFKDMFDFIKAHGKKVDHNEMIRQIIGELH